MSFHQVVHSGRIGETGVTTLQVSRSTPNEHSQECRSHARSSRGDGTFGHRRPPFQSPGCAGIVSGDVVHMDATLIRADVTLRFRYDAARGFDQAGTVAPASFVPVFDLQ